MTQLKQLSCQLDVFSLREEDLWAGGAQCPRQWGIVPEGFMQEDHELQRVRRGSAGTGQDGLEVRDLLMGQAGPRF